MFLILLFFTFFHFFINIFHFSTQTDRATDNYCLRPHPSFTFAILNKNVLFRRSREMTKKKSNSEVCCFFLYLSYLQVKELAETAPQTIITQSSVGERKRANECCKCKENFKRERKREFVRTKYQQEMSK